MSTLHIDVRQLMGQRNGDDNGDVFAATSQPIANDAGDDFVPRNTSSEAFSSDERKQTEQDSANGSSTGRLGFVLQRAVKLSHGSRRSSSRGGQLFKRDAEIRDQNAVRGRGLGGKWGDLNADTPVTWGNLFEQLCTNDIQPSTLYDTSSEFPTVFHHLFRSASKHLMTQQLHSYTCLPHEENSRPTIHTFDITTSGEILREEALY
ncbi:hypothetical protein ALC53_06774 [Atta colombica]|uniref:Uncharacterized protein n=1 Tax=Atta colombica TaxID=520822 RepID=A0A151I370_9HYME|nr:hypothetical protein ALC53_06774 [Atta colombica]